MLTAAVNSRGGMNTPLADLVCRETVPIQALQFSQEYDSLKAAMVDRFPWADAMTTAGVSEKQRRTAKLLAVFRGRRDSNFEDLCGKETVYGC